MSHVTTPQELQAVREELQALDLTDKGHKKRGSYRSISVTDKFLVTRYAVYSTPTKAIAAHPHLSVPYSSLTGWMSKYRTAKRGLGMSLISIPFQSIFISILICHRNLKKSETKNV